MKILGKLTIGLAALGMFALVQSDASAHVLRKHKSKNCRHLVRHTHPRPPKRPITMPIPSDPLALATCHADELQYLVGQDRSVLHTMRFSQTVRIEEPGMAYTMDYSEDRLRIQIGADGMIRRVLCG
ncbi:MAG: Uncharacterized protein FD163_1918 [Hyphomonadaceae bacterium]|nr:MAG: Uncharacterized protein FD128_2780 [Hyphomonadaceae bacterium]KAF0184344.1 MAG: Uncharacterized protein FD163_1918 [Hyphomonadaceae bacterium]